MEQPEERAIVFSDVCQSTRLYEAYGDARALALVGHAMALMSDAVLAHGGRVVRTLGDEVFSTFPDAEQALQAARRIHQQIQADARLAPHQIAVRIGLHFGEVLHEGGDVYGDAVNLAARVASLAKAHQILTTEATAAGLPPALRASTRSLGLLRVRGKHDEIGLCEFIWQQDLSDVTVMPGLMRPYAAGARLLLHYHERDVEAGARPEALQLGRGDQNDVVIPHPLVSRSHALIEYRHGKFVLKDRSTNGTYVCLESGEKFFVHHEELALHGSGLLGLGREPTDEDPDRIRFTCQG